MVLGAWCFTARDLLVTQLVHIYSAVKRRKKKNGRKGRRKRREKAKASHKFRERPERKRKKKKLLLLLSIPTERGQRTRNPERKGARGAES